MTYSPLNRSLIKYGARMRLQGNVFRSFFACLLPTLPLWLLSLFVTAAPTATSFYIQLESIIFAFPKTGYILPFFLIILRIFVANPMSVEMSRYFCKLMTTKNMKLNPLMVCNCFGKGYLTKMLCMLSIDLSVVAAYVFPITASLLIPGMIIKSVYDGLTMYVLSSWILPFMICGSASLIILTIRLCMTKYFLASENPFSIFQAIKSSISVTQGRTWELFKLNLSFLPWNLLDTLTRIAGIYYYPYRYAVESSYFLSFTSSDENNKACSFFDDTQDPSDPEDGSVT